MKNNDDIKNTPSDKDALEQIFLTREEFFIEEQKIRLREHFHRYASIRRFCYGKVLDFASGCGYGSFILASNPEITEITAVDKNKKAYDWAIKEYSHEKILYKNIEAENISGHFDTMVSLETIEHLNDPKILNIIAERCSVKQIILSFPNKKSTHFNSWHFHDLVVQDVLNIFTKYVVYHHFQRGDVSFLLLIRLPENAPFHIYRNITDLQL